MLFATVLYLLFTLVKRLDTLVIELLNKPVVHGETVKISCIYSDFDCQCINTNKTNKQSINTMWERKCEYVSSVKEVLVVDGQPANSSIKFAQVHGERNNEETLVIYKFLNMDICTYICTIQLQTAELPQKQIQEQYEYHPNEHEIRTEANVVGNDLAIDFELLKVFPLPKCTLNFTTSLQSNPPDLAMVTKPLIFSKNGQVDGIFFKVITKEKISLTNEFDKGLLIIMCQIGRTSIVIHKEQFSQIRNGDLESSWIGWLIAVIIAVILNIILVVCLCKIRRSTHRNYMLPQDNAVCLQNFNR